jgi:hypothetical protein
VDRPGAARLKGSVELTGVAQPPPEPHQHGGRGVARPLGDLGVGEAVAGGEEHSGGVVGVEQAEIEHRCDRTPTAHQKAN